MFIIRYGVIIIRLAINFFFDCLSQGSKFICIDFIMASIAVQLISIYCQILIFDKSSQMKHKDIT